MKYIVQVYVRGTWERSGNCAKFYPSKELAERDIKVLGIRNMRYRAVPASKRELRQT